MTGLSPTHLRELADRLEAEETEEKAKLADAETAEERSEIRTRLETLEKRNASLEAQIRARGEEPGSESENDGGEEDEEARPKMRKGRKQGMVYTNPETGMGEVYSGEDEPDLVPVEEEAA